MKKKKKWAYDAVIKNIMAKKNKELNEEFVELSKIAAEDKKEKREQMKRDEERKAEEMKVEEVESEIGGFERVDAEDALEGGWGVVEAAKKSGADVGGDVMAISAVAYFGHATAPWNVLGTKR